MRRWQRTGVWRDQTYTAITTDFNGLGELADFTASVPANLQYGHHLAQSLHGLRNGDERQVAQAEKLLAAYEARGLLAPLTPILRTGLVGMCPLVPAVLSGQPDNMLIRDTTDAMTDRSPITIMIDCGVIANVSTETMSMRGTALLALVMALQSIRPVTLKLFDTMSWDGINSKFIMWAIDFPTNPLHLAQLAFCLTSPLMARDLPFTHTNAILKQRVDGYGFAWNLLPHMPDYERQCREHWELAPHDLCFVGGSLEQGIGADPMQWVQDQIERLKHRQQM